MARENLTAFENMKVNLLANRLVPEKVPLVIQYNKQDLGRSSRGPSSTATLNFWGRKAVPAVAARGEGVMETFEAVVQDMLAAIALKYNLKEKGLDPEAVPERSSPRPSPTIVRRAPAAAPAPAPPRVIVAQPEGVEPAYPGQVGPEVSPVSEELLHRAIRSNVELAEALGQVVRDLSLGLGTLQGHTERFLTTQEDASRGALAAAIRGEVRRLQTRPPGRGPGGIRAPGRGGSRPRPAARAADAAPGDVGTATAGSSRGRSAPVGLPAPDPARRAAGGAARAARSRPLTPGRASAGRPLPSVAAPGGRGGAARRIARGRRRARRARGRGGGHGALRSRRAPAHRGEPRRPRGRPAALLSGGPAPGARRPAAGARGRRSRRPPASSSAPSASPCSSAGETAVR